MIWYGAANVRSAKFGGSGTASDPWSLSFALSTRSSLNAGDTLLLSGGVYYADQKLGRLICKLSGGELSAPITIRSVPGEWATIDGGLRSANASTIGDVASSSDESPSLRISCPHTVWQDLSITNSDSARLATPSLRKNSYDKYFCVF